MLRLIVKNLWARRRHNGWLLAELILVSIITWVIADPLVVITHNRSLPEGFRSEGLYLAKLSELHSASPLYRAEESDSIHLVANFERILQRLRSYEGVASVTPVLGNMMPYGRSIRTCQLKLDSTVVTSFVMCFVEKSDFFQTLGLEGAEGMTAAQLDGITFDPNDFVLTADASRSAPLLRRTHMSDDSLINRVAGVVKPFRMMSSKQPVVVSLYPKKGIDPSQIPGDITLLFRTEEGISADVFLHQFRLWMSKELKAGNLYVRSVKSYSSFRTDHELTQGVTNKYRFFLVLGLFFLVNLCLGVAGTFWMQTRSRSEEVGIMLSFGANPSYIMRLLIGEGWVLTTLATVIGCFVYFNYAVSDGLHISSSNLSPDYLINNFGFHFLLVSLLVWLILLLVVTIGVYIPARRISRINPVEALRDE